jgi:hypothetical protein
MSWRTLARGTVSALVASLSPKHHVKVLRDYAEETEQGRARSRAGLQNKMILTNHGMRICGQEQNTYRFGATATHSRGRARATGELHDCCHSEQRVRVRRL